MLIKYIRYIYLCVALHCGAKIIIIFNSKNLFFDFLYFVLQVRAETVLLRIMKIAIFDLDGTLLNTITDLGYACNYALQAFGFEQHPISDYHKLVGNGVNKLLERALPEGYKTEENILQLRSAFVPYYNEHNKIYTHPYDGIQDMLYSLNQNGYKLAVASNKYQAATESIVRYFFGDLFDVILGERSGCPRKPDPQIVRDILAALGADNVEKNNVFYIGDSDVDINTAHAACLPAIACTWGFCSRETLQALNPEYIIDSTEEILKLLL